jgi:UDP-N-acetylglucosamine 2-epimerase (non-hydrolysing)
VISSDPDDPGPPRPRSSSACPAASRCLAAAFSAAWLRGIPSQVRVIPPAGYLDFIALQASARLVLLDSGGVQEETTVLGVPCLTLPENTERPITIIEGTNQLDPEQIVTTALGVLKAPSPRRPPALGRAGRAAYRRGAAGRAWARRPFPAYRSCGK